MNDNINMDSTLANDNINMDSTIAESVNASVFLS
jgi:hypothetical protein